MIDLSIAIQHTPSRADRRTWVRAILNQLRAEDPSIPITLIEDTEHEGCWPTYRRALEAAGDVSHHLILQDDLGLCRDFIGSVKEVILARPDNLIALYTNAEAVLTARSRGESWIEKPGVCGPSMIWPKHLIAEFLQWQDKHVDCNFEFDTVRVSMWLIKTSKRAFATVPSLTEHLGYASSTLGLNSPTKVATWYIGEERSALGIDWSQGLSSPAKATTHIHQEWWDHFRE
ncbi:MAG TPA: hypothetical protein VF131_07720 [Blastocatellia bacterium]|nr:hypothetical protein [Blastocatellia bacterium]